MTKSRPVRDLALALTLLTCLPLPTKNPAGLDESDSASWFPFVGLLIGLGVSGVLLLAQRFFYGVSPTLTAFVLMLVALLTRMLHWDGLADVADAYFVPEARRLEVLADTHVGAFGVTAIVLLALVEWSALTEVSATRAGVGVVLLALVFSRAAATCAAWFGKPARPGGLGDSVMSRPSLFGLMAGVGVAALGAWIAYLIGLPGWTALGVTGVAVVLALVVPHALSLRFGGVTGDVMGASVQIVEAMVLVSGLVILSLLRLLGVSA